ncbi:hypothetical protein BDQ17DRAFT_1430351 [Cyathus striatus]|nr:hypothetical protein BDQ17DRAFT_1430351 [Cyathus striatus]
MLDSVLTSLILAYTKDPDSEDSFRHWKCKLHAPIEVSDDDDCIEVIDAPFQSPPYSLTSRAERATTTDVQTRDTSLVVTKQPKAGLLAKEFAVVDLTISSDEEPTDERKEKKSSPCMIPIAPIENHTRMNQYSEPSSVPSGDQPITPQEVLVEERGETLAPIWVLQHAIKNGQKPSVANDKGVARYRKAPSRYRTTVTLERPLSFDITRWLRNQKARGAQYISFNLLMIVCYVLL